MGRATPVPCSRTTRLPLRGAGARTRTSCSGYPAARNRVAMASAARVLSPTESVVLISISCLKMSRASCCGCCALSGRIKSDRARGRICLSTSPAPANGCEADQENGGKDAVRGLADDEYQDDNGGSHGGRKYRQTDCGSPRSQHRTAATN